MEDDSYNSDEFTRTEGRPNPFAQLGQASMASMSQRTKDDRVESKVAVVNLVFHARSPRTEKQRYLWMNRFHFFRINTLRRK